MKERPISFSGPMVRAILAGTKTQTRRLVWHEPTKQTGRELADPAGGVLIYRDGAAWHPDRWDDHLAGSAVARWIARCPYGVPIYRADGEQCGWQWRPSIHMPRWASRLTLEVTDVRVQRLQEISEEDAKAEGVTTAPLRDPSIRGGWIHPEAFANPHGVAFRHLWDSINAKRAPWDSNPWVWAVTFRRAS